MEWSERISKAINYMESHITEELILRSSMDMIHQTVLQKHFFVFMALLLLPYAKNL